MWIKPNKCLRFNLNWYLAKKIFYQLNLLSIYITCILSFFVTANVCADNIIKGIVKDKQTNEPLIGATVLLKGTNAGSTTDFDGKFEIKTQANPPYLLQINYVGYSPVTVTVSDISKAVVIKLEESIQQLNDVEIKDSRISEKQKQAPITIETMDAIAIKQTPAANFYEGLAHLKGVDLTAASIGFKIINTRGFNSTSPVRSLQLIDGVDNQSPGLNFSLGNFLGASEIDIQKVDLVVGASSSYYGPNAFNGVINMQTKSPFLSPGLTASVKVGERSLLETALRWAQIIKNKKGEDKFAYKANIFYMQAYDWNATNYEPTYQSPVDKNNPGGYDAVNRYGDEFSSGVFYTKPSSVILVGRGYYLRDGYAEKDLVDYNTYNLKTNLALHYKITKDIEAIYTSAFSTGTTVYQGDNRFSLKDILFYQNRFEVRKENKFFVRVYTTSEDAGKSYDAYSTAIKMQNASKPDNYWAMDYNNALSKHLGGYLTSWYSRNLNSGLMLKNIPNAERLNFIENYWRSSLIDSLYYFHNMARNIANGPSAALNYTSRVVPGTFAFDSLFQKITSSTNTEGGSRLFDRSALYHAAAEYRWTMFSTTCISGGNFRLYAPNSQGTIFSDTGDVLIRNKEFGVYLGVEKDLLNKNLKFSATARVDKNENFQMLFSPAATIVYINNKQIFRTSISSAIRNPTLADQYILMNVGRAVLKGNLNGFDSLVTVSSFIDALDNGKSYLQYFNVAPIQPEEVKTIEFGYRGSIWKDKFFYDISYYHSWYTSFIGYKIGADINWQPGALPEILNIYRVAANAVDRVTTQGITIGIQYFYSKIIGLSCNYSWNKLDRNGSTDPLIPAFNTPEHKYNIGISGREFNINYGELTSRFWSYGINYKYQTEFMFEGSPQFTGTVPAYDMVDAQLSKRIPQWYLTCKIGASNLLDNRVYQVYGGPHIGRMAYISLLLELNNWK